MGENKAGFSVETILVLIYTTLACILLNFLYKIFRTRNNVEEEVVEKDSGEPAVESSLEEKSSERSSGKAKKRAAWKGKTEFTHPWLLKNLKGHPGTVVHGDFSANGKFMAATCDDGSVILWDIRDLTVKEHKTLRVNIQFDHATRVAWSPDSKAFIVHTARENNILVFKIERKKDGTIGSASQVLKFEKVHEADAVGFGISSNGKFIMSCSAKTDMVLFDLKGQKLDELDTYLMSTHSAKISPCGRFVVATGFSPDVKVMEVQFTKQGAYKGVAKAFELSGHSSGVYDVAFDVDTSHIATISKDGTWKLYHTKVNFALGESPHVLETGRYSPASLPPRIALSPDAAVLAVAADSSIQFYDTYTGELYDTIDGVFAGPVNYMQFDSSGKYVYVFGDRAVRVLHSVCGYHTTAAGCRRLLASKQTSATVERLNRTVAECNETLAKFGK